MEQVQDMPNQKVGFFSRMKTVIDFFSLSVIHLKLQKEQDDEKIHRQIEKLTKVVNRLENSPVVSTLNTDLKDNINTLTSLSTYVINFYYGNFEESFNQTQNAYYSLKKDGPKQAMLINMIDSLCAMKHDLKTEREKEVYHKNYGQLENHYCQLLENAISHNHIENYAKSGNNVVSAKYDGSYMSLAYMSYLNKDEAKTQDYLAHLVQTQGAEKVVSYECEQSANKWFYKHQNDEYKNLVKDYIAAHVSQNKQTM